jgi:putative effector of murein hydrolase LrgA (UPF0299 family)
MLLRGLTFLVLFQLLGTAINALILPMLPAPIIGLVALFLFLLAQGEVGEPLNTAASGLLRYLPLLLVPPSVGIMAYGGALLDQFWPIAAALSLSLILSIALCGVLMQKLMDRQGRRQGRT